MTRIVQSGFKITEAQLQLAVKQFADLHLLPMHHSPNEARRSPQLGKRLKDEGMIPGFSDCFFMRSSANGYYKGLFIELKIPPNKPTVTQKNFLELIKNEGYLGIVCYGIDDAINAIKMFYDLY